MFLAEKNLESGGFGFNDHRAEKPESWILGPSGDVLDVGASAFSVGFSRL